jgi:glycine/sarcosine N-methyltransferase
MYDTLSADYDRFVDWPARLALELPLLEKELAAAGAQAVLDAACGTGRHAIELARRGFKLSAADFSAGMIAQARANAADAGAGVRFEQAGFGGLESVFGTSAFDAILCLGNSLPHAQNPSGLTSALKDFSACLKQGGLLILQNRNFDRLLAERRRWIDPQSACEAGREWLFIRFYDFEADGSISFHILTLSREDGGKWGQTASSTRLWPLPEADLADALAGAGFGKFRRYGSAGGEPFERDASPDLILTARKKEIA